MATGVQVQYRRGTASQVASFTGAAGELVIDTTNNRVVVQDGTTAGGWPQVRQGDATTLASLGIGTADDPGNPLSVTANNTLFNALGTTSGGTGDMRIKLNKASAGNTASFLFQDGFSGRAEFGLTGDDNFHMKVAPDGSTWTTAITINATTGAVTFANGQGAATISFGAFPGASDTAITISDPGIVPGSVVQAEIMVAATSDHSADEHWVEEIDITAGNIVAGVGFTIYARCRQGSPALYGAWNVSWMRR